jgi:hypothetical protein
LRASDRLAGAGWSGVERHGFRMVERNPCIHAVLRPLPKLRVVGSSPIARSLIEQAAMEDRVKR